MSNCKLLGIGLVLCGTLLPGCALIMTSDIRDQAEKRKGLEWHRAYLAKRLASPDSDPQVLKSPNELDFEKILDVTDLGHLYRAIHTEGMTDYLQGLLKNGSISNAPLARILLYAMGDDSTEVEVRKSYHKFDQKLQEATKDISELEGDSVNRTVVYQNACRNYLAEPVLAGIALRHRGDLGVLRDVFRAKGTVGLVRPEGAVKRNAIDLLRQKAVDSILTGLWQDLPRKMAIEFLSDREEAVRRGADGVVFRGEWSQDPKAYTIGRCGYGYRLITGPEPRRGCNAVPLVIQKVGAWYVEYLQWSDEEKRQIERHRIGGPVPYTEFRYLNPWAYKLAIQERLGIATALTEKQRLAAEYDRARGADYIWDFGLDYPGKQLDPLRVRRILGVALKNRKLLEQMTMWTRLSHYYSMIAKDDVKWRECGTRSSDAQHKALRLDVGITGWFPHYEDGLAYMNEIEQQLLGKGKPIIETYGDLWELSSLHIAYTHMFKAKTLKEFEFWNHRDFFGASSIHEWDKVRRQAIQCATDADYYYVVRAKVIESLKARNVSPKELGMRFAMIYLCREYYRELDYQKKYYERNHRVEPDLRWTQEQADLWHKLVTLKCAIEGDYYMLRDLKQPAEEYRKHIEDTLAKKKGNELKSIPLDENGHGVDSPNLERYCRILAITREWIEAAKYEELIESHMTFYQQLYGGRSFYLPKPYNTDIQKTYPNVLKRFNDLRKDYLKRIKPDELTN